MNNTIQDTYNKLARVIIPHGTMANNIRFSYDYIDSMWIPLTITKDNKLIKNSFCFSQQVYSDYQENGNINTKGNYIFSRILNNYHKCIDCVTPIEINDPCVFLHNTFSTGNAGHDLNCSMSVLQMYLDNPNVKFILLDEIHDTNNLQLIHYLIPDKNRILIVKQQQVYNFNNLIIHNEHDNPNTPITYATIIQRIHNELEKEYIKQDMSAYNNKKVLIIKNSSMNYTIRREDKFVVNKLLEYLRKKGWYIINPEDTSQFLLNTYLLSHASVIVTGQRGISAANQIFYNKNAQVINFMVGHTTLLANVAGMHFDPQCNGMYHARLKKTIYTPLDTDTNNIECDKLKSIFDNII